MAFPCVILFRLLDDPSCSPLSIYVESSSPQTQIKRNWLWVSPPTSLAPNPLSDIPELSFSVI